MATGNYKSFDGKHRIMRTKTDEHERNYVVFHEKLKYGNQSKSSYMGFRNPTIYHKISKSLIFY